VTDARTIRLAGPVESDDGDHIRLTVPATPASARIARVAAAGLATRAGFTYREVEQFRLAVDEAAALLTGALAPPDAPPAAVRGRRLVVAYLLARDGLHVELEVEGDGGTTAAAVPHLAALLLDASIDDWEVAPDGLRVVLHKRRPHVGGEDDEG
jgi:hypothetical protein